MLNCCIHHKISTTQQLHPTPVPQNISQDVTSRVGTTPPAQDKSTTQEHAVRLETTAQDSFTAQRATTMQDTSSEDDEEFYEAQEEMSSDHVIQSSDHMTGNTVSQPWEGREGVLHPYQDLVLITTGEPLCVPITQVTSPAHNSSHHHHYRMLLQSPRTQFLSNKKC